MSDIIETYILAFIAIVLSALSYFLLMSNTDAPQIMLHVMHFVQTLCIFVLSFKARKGVKQ